MSILRTNALSPLALSFATTAALGLATFTFVMPAHAATAPITSQQFEQVEGDMPAIRVSYADLDLTTDQGRRAMRHRLAAAAHMVCDDATSITDPLKARAAYRQCKEEALDNAITNFAVKMKAKQLAQR